MLAGALLLLAVVHALVHGDDRVGALLITVALTVPLAWRRRNPAAVFLIVAAVAFAQWLLGLESLGDIALLIGLYTVAVQETRWRALLAAAILELGAVLAAVDDGGLRGFIGLSALAVAAGVLGTSVRNRRALLASLEDRAARLEVERDQQGLLAAAAERARIAREMHDIVAHNLTVMIALADGAVFAAARAPEKATTAMGTVSDTGRQALAEMRRLLGVLREDDGGSELVPQPGVPQIDQLVEQVRAAGLPVTLEVAGDGRDASTRRAAHRFPARAGGPHERPQARRRIGRCGRQTPLRRRCSRRRGHGQRGEQAEDRRPRRPRPRWHARARRGVRGNRRSRASTRRRLARPRASQARELGGHMTTRILLVDDQPLLRMGFRMVLESQDDLEVVGEAGDGGEALRMTAELDPDIVLMDVRMPGMDGIEATSRIVGRGLRSRVHRS